MSDVYYERGKALFDIAKSSHCDEKMSEYVLNEDMRKGENNPNKDATAHDYQKALFYLYGNCEDIYDAASDKNIMAHGLLKRFELYGESEEVAKTLSKQVVEISKEESEDQLDSEDQILKFLTQHSKYGKHFKEIELVAETLSSKIYMVKNIEDEIAIKIPKLIPDHEQETIGFLDLIF